MDGGEMDGGGMDGDGMEERCSIGAHAQIYTARRAAGLVLWL